MGRAAATGLLVALCLAVSGAGAQARLLATGTTKSVEHPKTAAAGQIMVNPRGLSLDVIARPSARVKAEWFVLCTDGHDPVTGGEYLGRPPLHRRIVLHKRSPGLCLVDVEAKFADAGQRGRITVRLRGEAQELPLGNQRGDERGRGTDVVDPRHRLPRV